MEFYKGQTVVLKKEKLPHVVSWYRNHYGLKPVTVLGVVGGGERLRINASCPDIYDKYSYAPASWFRPLCIMEGTG